MHVVQRLRHAGDVGRGDPAPTHPLILSGLHSHPKLGVVMHGGEIRGDGGGAKGLALEGIESKPLCPGGVQADIRHALQLSPASAQSKQLLSATHTHTHTHTPHTYHTHHHNHNHHHLQSFAIFWAWKNTARAWRIKAPP